MGGVDKLFTKVAGRPLLTRTLVAFQECPAVARIVLVLSRQNLERGRRLVKEHGFPKVTAVVLGGERRQDSVRVGLEALTECDFVAVHDGGRPLVTAELIERGIAAAQETGAAVPAIPLVDTIKEAGPEGVVVRTLDRSRLWAVQTPQMFRFELLMRAHREVTADVTDDAAMVEALGLPVRLFEGDHRNVKVTTAEDVRMVEALLQAETTGRVILHITSRVQWEEARTAGAYRGDTLDTEGFIHCSTLAQFVDVANANFGGRTGLVVLCVDSDKVAPEIRYEESGPGGPFPHIYGALTVDAVVKTTPFEPNSEGRFEMPAGIAEME